MADTLNTADDHFDFTDEGGLSSWQWKGKPFIERLLSNTLFKKASFSRAWHSRENQRFHKFFSLIFLPMLTIYAHTT